MVVQLDRINAELESLTRRLNFEEIPIVQMDARFTQLASQMSQLGTEVGQIAGGFQSLTQELDVTPEQLDVTISTLENAAENFSDGAVFELGEELQNIRGVANRGIVMLADNPPGLAIRNAASQSTSDLEALTEGTVQGGFNNLVVTANVPEAMAEQMSRVAGVALIEAEAAVQEILPQVASLQGRVQTTLNNLQNNLPVINDLFTEVSSFTNNANQVLNVVQNARGMLNDLVENISGAINADIRNLLSIDVNIPPHVLNDAVRLLQSGSIEAAAQLLVGFADIPITELTDRLSDIRVNLGSQLESRTSPATANNPTPTISPTQRPERRDQPIEGQGAVFGTISSIDRDITELVFRTVSLAETSITTLQSLNGDDYPSFHFIVNTDGSVTRNAALSDLLEVAGHEEYSIGVLVGARNNRVSVDQSAAIDNIIQTFLSIIPYGQILNYSEIAVDTRPEIIFDFVDYATEHFNYRSAMPNNIRSLSTQELQLILSDTAGGGEVHGNDEV